MIKLLRHKIEGYFIVKEYDYKGVRYEKKYNPDQKAQALKDYKRLKRNAYTREKNSILSDICGTSARQAKIDMGL